MKFLVEILGGSSFKIEIVHDSQIQLEVSPDVNPNHNGNDQMPETEQSPAPWITVEDYFERQGWPLTAEEIRKIYSYRPETTQEISKNQDSHVTVGSSNKNDHQVLHQTEQSPPSNSVKETINIQDSSVKFANKNNNDLVPPQSNSVKNITKSNKRGRKKRKMVVGVSPYSGMNEVPKNILLTVISMDEVKTLRDEMVQREQRGDIELPQEGYFFTHNNQVLNEDQSYEWNGVKPVDTIVMVPRNVIQETRKIQDSSVTVQVPQTEQPPASNSVRETVNTQDSSLKVGSMLVRVLPINTLVKVNATDDVKTLREMLFQSQQRGQIQKLPRDGYFLTHKKQVLKEDQSYEWNGIKNAGTIVIVPRRFTQDTSKIQDSSVTVGRSNKNHQVLQAEHIINRPQDLSVTVQVPQTEQSPASNSVLSLKEISDILDAPENDPKQKKKVYVMPFSS
ncbi:unnamed protein product [Arabidopsis halleri]